MTLAELLALAAHGAVREDDLAALAADDPALNEAIAVLTEAHRTSPDDTWSAQTLYAGARCEVALFALSEGDEIPLHDHPSMVVYMRALVGELTVEAWDLCADASSVIFVARETLRVGDGLSSALPWRGNLHRVTAQRESVFIDVLTPPYGPTRCCTEWRLLAEPDVHGVAPVEVAYVYDDG